MPIPAAPLPKDPSPEPRNLVLRGLERAAGQLNPFLTILAVGIAILDLTCYVGIAGSRQLAPHQQALAPTPAHASADIPPVDYGH
jgi:hypothetical protein